MNFVCLESPSINKLFTFFLDEVIDCEEIWLIKNIHESISASIPITENSDWKGDVDVSQLPSGTLCVGSTEPATSKANYRFWQGLACTSLTFPDKQSRLHRHKTQRLEKLAAEGLISFHCGEEQTFLSPPGQTIKWTWGRLAREDNQV